MTRTINNNDLVLIDPDEEAEVVAHLMLKMNAFISVRTAELATTLDKVTQARERKSGRFPKLYKLSSNVRRKAYRINDIKSYLENPTEYRQE